jgi:hypothetical protein
VFLKKGKTYYWKNTKSIEEVLIFDLPMYVKSKADTFVMFKVMWELHK